MDYLSFTKLNTTRDGYSSDASLWGNIDLHRYNDVSGLRSYLLQKRSWETSEEYQDRCTAFTYTPLMSSLIRNMGASLASSPFVVSTRSQDILDLATNVDLKGTADIQLIQDIFYSLLFYGCSYIVIDNQDGTPYLTLIHPKMVIDEGDRWFRTKQLITTRTIFGDSETKVRFTLYSKDFTKVYEVPVLLKNGEIVACLMGGKPVELKKAVVPLVAEDNHGLTCAMVKTSIPTSAYLGKLLVEKQNQYSRVETAWTLSGMVAGQVIRMFTPVITDNTDPRKLQQPNYDELKLSSQRVLVGSNFMFAESTGTAISNLTSQLEKIEQQMYTITAQTITGEPSMAVSGVSKGIDAEAMNAVMREYGHYLRKYWETILRKVQKLMGLKIDAFVTGFNDFELAQREKLLDTSIKVGGFEPFLPKVVQKLWWEKVSKALVGTVTPEILSEMQEELDEIFYPTETEIPPEESEGTE